MVSECVCVGGRIGDVGNRSRGAASVKGLGLEDLAALCDGPGLTLHLSRDEGRARVGKGKKPLYRRAGGREWKRVNRRARAEILLGWIREAASVTRGRLLVGRAGA